MSRALIVVDVQRDFCEGGSLAVRGGTAVAEAITRHIADQKGAYAAIAATRDAHIDPGGHFADEPDYVRTWPRHCVIGTPGFDFTPGFEAAAAQAVFDKGHYTAAYSGFEGVEQSGTSLAEWLRARDVDEVDIVGIATDHCVRATALDAEAAGFGTRVLLDLTAGVAPQSTEEALRDMSGAGVILLGTPRVAAP